MLKSVQGYNCPKCVANSLPFADLDENETYLEFNVSRISDSNWINKASFTIQSLIDQISISSKYYKPSEFLECKLPANNFTVLHLNIASLKSPKTPFRYHRDNRDKDVR